MSAVALIDRLSRAGVRLERRGDHLHVEAPRGTVTPELRLILTENKAGLLAALDTRDRLMAAAREEFVDERLVASLSDADVEACRDLPALALRAYVRALQDSDNRERGQVPPDETARALCRKCGPVWIAPEVAAVAPLVDGWPRLIGCPWCHVKARHLIPRPPVMCGECRHFARDSINPEGGMGQCRAGCEPERPFPYAKQQCATFSPGAK